MHIGYWWESQKERDNWEDQDVGGRTILKLNLEGWDGMDWINLAQDRDQRRALVNLEGWDGMDWINLAQDRDQWRALVNTVMNLRVP
jgi:hypothetical protein